MKHAVLTIGLAATLLLSGALWSEAGEKSETRNKKPAPAFELKTLEGKTVSNKDVLGKPTLLIFWAPWCHVCQKELPKAAKMYEEFKGRGFEILAIGFADTEKSIKKYVRSNPETFPYPVLYDKGDLVSRRYGVTGTPTLFLLNKKGEVEVPFRGGGLIGHPKFQEIVTGLL